MNGRKKRDSYFVSLTLPAIVIAVPYFPPALLIVGTLSPPSLFVDFISTVSYSPESNNHSDNCAPSFVELPFTTIWNQEVNLSVKFFNSNKGSFSLPAFFKLLIASLKPPLTAPIE